MSRATETFQLVQVATAGTTTGAATSVDGATLGTIHVDTVNSGTFTVEVKARAHADAGWQALYVINQDGTRSASISAAGMYDVWVFGRSDVQISTTAHSGSITVAIYLGLNS